MLTADIVFGLAWGDEGKGKVVSGILSRKKRYNYVCRWNGGPNAGHTVYLNGKKYKTHQIPSGVFHDVTSIIGPNCVVDPIKLNEEIKYMEENGFNPRKYLKIHPHANIITQEHIRYDQQFLAAKLGTTGCGIAPCYADRALRKGLLAKEYYSYASSNTTDLLWNMHFKSRSHILCEGAQGMWLDMNQGTPPFTTSSETLPYAACSLGFSHREIGEVIGVAKAYDTRSGEDPRFPNSLLECPERGIIGATGKEYGTTTGRKRKVDFLDLDALMKAIDLSGTTKVIINKGDVLEQCGIFKIKHNREIVSFSSYADMKQHIIGYLVNTCWMDESLISFSNDPESIPKEFV
jgi:adenylosuccinate synthase